MTVDDDILIGYALGHLSPEDERAVAAHLRAHPEDAEQVAGYFELLADIALALPPEPLPATGEADLLARVRAAPSAPTETEPATTEPATTAAPPAPVVVLPRERGGRSTAWWLAGLGAAAVLVGVYFTVVAPLNPDVQIARELQEYQAEPGAASYTLIREGTGVLGTLVRLPDGRVFVALDAPPAEPQVYQAWAIRDAPASLGTFSDRTFLSEAAVPPGATFGLTLEPPGGSDAPTSTPLTLLEL